MSFLRSLPCLLLLAVAACGGDDAPDQPTAPTLNRIDREPAGAHCPGGGSAVHLGVDDNGNARLDDAEIEHTEYACQPAAAAAVARRVAEPAGAHCPVGGLAIQTGRDANGNAQLDDAEVDHTEYACDAAPLTMVVRVDAEPAGAHCTFGGSAVKVGPDVNGNRALDDAEVADTDYVCETASSRILVRQTDEPAGSHCTLGGIAVVSGADKNGNGVLDGSEASATSYVCDEPAARALSRQLAEPAGTHCAQGGTAIQTGVDDDHSGALDAAEVDATSYVCTAADAPVLIRSDAEPAGAHCTFGGTAVSSGLDDNHNGILETAEIDRTTYACSPAPAKALLRSDVEPAGANCAFGGTAIRAGIDRNGNTVLDNDEIDRTTYVCRAATATLSRTRAEPAGPHCAQGGTAVDIGIDDNHDGTLDDAEVDTTAYACTTTDVIEGDVRIDDATSAGDLARFVKAKSITGNVAINRGGPVALSLLTTVGGSIVIGAGSTAFGAPALTAIQGDLTIGGATIGSIELRAVKTIGGALTIHDTPLLAAVQLSALTSVGRDLVLDSSSALSAPLLADVHGTVSLSGKIPTGVLVGNLARIDGDLWLDGTVPALGMVALQRVGGTLLVDRDLQLPTLAFGNLTEVGGMVQLSSKKLQVFAATRLATVGESVVVRGTEQLTAVALQGVTSIGSAMFVEDAPLLNLLRLDLLERIGGGIHLHNLPKLTVVPLGALTSIKARPGDALVVDTTGLTALALPKLATVEGAVALRDNKDLGVVVFGDALTRLDRVSLEGHAALTAVKIGKLTTVTDRVLVSLAPRLDTLLLPQLAGAGGLTVLGTGLSSLTLPALTKVGRLQLSENPALAAIDGLRALTELSDLVVDHNATLLDLVGLERVTAIAGDVTVTGNAKLRSVHGLDNVRSVDDLTITDQEIMTSLGGLQSLQVAGTLTVKRNKKLTALSGLDALTNVTTTVDLAGNPDLPAAEVSRLLTQLGRAH